MELKGEPNLKKKKQEQMLTARFAPKESSGKLIYIPIYIYIYIYREREREREKGWSRLVVPISSLSKMQKIALDLMPSRMV